MENNQYEEQEKEKVLTAYFKDGLTGSLSQIPRKEKRKRIVFEHISQRFESEKEYAEKDVNEILRPIYDDFVRLRRYLIDYGFVSRSKDCSRYWIN